MALTNAPMWSADRRLSRIMPSIYYVGFVLAGIFGMVAPSRSIESGVPTWGIYIWGSFYIFGGVFCLVSVLWKSRGGDIVGLPLISSASGIYGVALLIQYFSLLDGAYLAVSSILIGQAIIMCDRWIYSMRLFRKVQGAAVNGH